MDVVCEVCGAVGVKHLLVQCNNCKNSTRHRYCLDTIIYDGSSIEWFCDDCLPKHNKVMKSLEDVSNLRQLSHIQLDSSVINGPNMNGAEVTKELCSWAHRRYRSRKARRDSSEHFLSGGTFNSSKMFVGEKFKRNDVEKEGESENEHLIYAPQSADSSSHSASDPASEINERISFQKTMGGSEPSVSFTEWLNLSKEKDSCSFQSKYVEGPIRQETKADLFPSINHTERSHPFVTDDSCPALPNVEQADGSTRTLESAEQPHPLEVVEPLVHMAKSILGSKSPSCYSQPMEGSDLNIGSMDGLDPSKECLDSRSMSKTAEPSSSSNGQGDSSVEKYSAETTKCLPDKEIVTAALDTLKGSSPSMAEECLDSNVDNSNEANRSDTHFLCTIDNKERGQSRVPSYQNISSGKVHSSCNGFDERGNSRKGNESSNPKPALKGNQHGRNLQNDVRKTSVRVGKNVVCRRVTQMEGVNSAALPSKPVSPCKATKSSSKKRNNRPNRHTPQHTKHQKTKIIKKNRNADPAQLKSGRPSKQLDHTSLELSSKTKEVHDANDAEPRCSNAAQGFENVMPKKRKRLILPYNEDEDADAMQVEDLNPQSCENDGLVKKHRRYVESGLINQRRSVENREEVLRPGNSNHQHVNNDTQAKKQRSIEANDDKDALLEDANVGCAQSDTPQLASQSVVAEDHYSLSRMPVISTPTDQQCYICTQPIDKPYWTGIMKIGQEYISLAAHLSNQACKMVQELSRSLPPIMKVTKLSKLKAWPKRWEASEPTAESIGLYFLSDNMRANKDLDRLVQYVTDHSIVLKYVVGFTKLLIFPSVLLPEQSQMFQGKHYLWGVFKRRKIMSKKGTPVEKQVAEKKMEQQDKVQGCTSQVAEKKLERQDKVQGCTSQVAEKKLEQQDKVQGCTSQVAEKKMEQQDKVQGCTSQVAEEEIEQQDKVQGDTLDQEMPISKHIMPSESQPSPGTVPDVDTETEHSDHGKTHSNAEATPPKLFGLVVAQTPRSEQFIRELENEGALVFAVKGLGKPGPIRL